VILAAVSFSAASRVALGLAAWLSQQYGAELHVLYVEDPLLIAAADYIGFDLLRDTHEQLQRMIGEVWPSASSLPNSYVIGGPTVEVILDVAHDAHADLVVVGQCGLSGAERLVFDAMPDDLLKRSDVSVLVATADQQRHFGGRI
jgi:nucleotide-binding universal stress UspA family protein